MADQGGPAGLRRSYERGVLLEAEAEPDPIVQFGRWFEEAAAGGEIYEPNAMMLATVGADGRPACRAVLLKGFDERGFTFYTNLESRKAEELAANPYAALLFWWDRLHRQVRVEGPVELVDAAEADAYFASPAPRQPDRRLGVAAEPGDRRAGSRWRRRRRSCAHGSRRASPSRGRRTGAATGSGRRRSSSGRDGGAGCTTGCATRGTATAGGSSGWRRDLLSALMLRSPSWCSLRRAVGSGS